MIDLRLVQAVAHIPAGGWAVGVSGGADSVALLSLLRRRIDLSLQVVHLDHQTRGQASTDDAAFVEQLSRAWNLPATLARRSEIEAGLTELPANPSARYRALRLELFRRVVGRGGLQGVILAHHADDQAETVLHRLLRGSPPAGLGAMRLATTIGGLLILRPLLVVSRAMLRQYLSEQGQAWREDASNASDQYRRNVVRGWLGHHTDLSASLCQLGAACAAWSDWIGAQAPELEAEFEVSPLDALPRFLLEAAGRRWLRGRGVSTDELSPTTMQRWLDLVLDAASPPRQTFPGPIQVRRRQGRIWAEPGARSH